MNEHTTSTIEAREQARGNKAFAPRPYHPYRQEAGLCAILMLGMTVLAVAAYISGLGAVAAFAALIAAFAAPVALAFGTEQSEKR